MHSTEVHLRARIFRCEALGAPAPWYADIDDPTYPQPDEPYWYSYYETQSAALVAACDRLAALS
ncbi:MAG TPA: hypothetical protein VGJ44_26435 [Kribbellaceae bacterium]|jgi:hypothetical protein